MAFLPAVTPSDPHAVGELTRGARWFVFRGPDLALCEVAHGRYALPGGPDALGVALTGVHYVGTLQGAPAYSASVPEGAPLPEGVACFGLRAAHPLVSEEAWAAAGYAYQVQHWDRTTRYCGACGARTEALEGERAKRCPGCGHVYYPRVSPCTITLVHDGDRILMTRQAAWPEGRYGLVAGFVEPQESLEDCARREVLEETSVTLGEVEYQGSQGWPFPHQLMVGFFARYAGGEVVPRAGELEDARWFPVGALPLLPPPFSIARKLIDRYVRARTG